MDNNDYRSIIEKSPVGYALHRVVYDQDGIPCDYEFIEVNSAFERYTGIKGSDIIGRKYSEVMQQNEADNTEWISSCIEIAINGGSKEQERYSMRLNRWFRILILSQENDCFITWTTDISKEMKEIEERNILLTSINDIIFQLDESYCFIDVITADDSGLFMPREMIMGKRIDALFPRELSADFLAAFKRCEVSREKEYIRYKSPMPEDDRWFEAGIFLWDSDSSKITYIASIREITGRKKTEEALVNKTEELERFFNVNLDLLCIADLQGNFIKVNNAWEKILGYTSSELEERKFLEFVHPEDMESTLATMSRLERNEQIRYFVNRYICSDGSYRYIEWCSQPYKGLIYAAARDITDRKLTEEALRLSEERLDIAMKATKAGLWDWDIKSDTCYYSSIWKSLLGYQQDEIDSSFSAWKELWHPEEVEQNEKTINDYISGKIPNYEIAHRLRSKNGDWRWILTRGELLRDSKGEPTRWIGTNIDITRIKEAEKEIRYLSFHDQLTGLYNRRFYEEELDRLDTIRNMPLSLIMADVNGLKLANDAFGHMIGDRILKKAADVIKNECRSDEIVSRIGVDEFVIILPRTDSYGAEILAKRIKLAISNERVDLLDLSVSLGWATKKHPREAVEDIFNKAEHNMYKHKLSESPVMKEKALNHIQEYLYSKLPEERAHSKRVSKLCEEIATKLGFSKDDIEVTKAAAMLHDIGLITLNIEILQNPGKLDDAEWVEIKRHSEKGYLILSSVNSRSQHAKYVLHHHERWNGSGYPNGLMGEQIPLQSRIIAIADAYDVMTHRRPYRNALSREAAVKELRLNAGTQFDPDLVLLFVEDIIKVSDFE